MSTKAIQDSAIELPEDPAVSLSVRQAAALLGLREPTIRKLTCLRSLPFYKLGGRVVFDREELLAWRAARRIPTLDEGTPGVARGRRGAS